MEKVGLPNVAHCINLAERTENWERAKKLWESIIPVERVEAIDKRPNGILGCYASHLHILRYEAYKFRSGHGDNEPLFIIEDDAIPCSDFNERLALFMPQLPSGWEIFMLGYWPMRGYELVPVTKHISQAKKLILATHCYMVNRNFIPRLIEIYETSPEKNLDFIFRALQQTNKVYAAVPSFSYQEGKWSDTGNCETYYAPMLAPFKDKL